MTIPWERGGYRGEVALRVITSGEKPFAILADGPEGRFLLPPVVEDLAGNVIEGCSPLVWILTYGAAVEIPVLRNCTSGDLAEIDQRLAALRDQHGARPWPPLDRRDDPQPPGGLRGRIGRLRRDLRPGPLPPCLDAAAGGPAVRAATSAGGKAAAPRHRCTSDQMPGQAARGGRFQAGAACGGRASPGGHLDGIDERIAQLSRKYASGGQDGNEGGRACKPPGAAVAPAGSRANSSPRIWGAVS